MDIGSAITFDIVDKNGVFIGGNIFAGNEIILTSLSSNTERLFEVNIDGNIHFGIGKSSTDCLKIGIFYSTFFAIREFVREYKKIIGNSHVLLTGGGSKIYKEKFPEFIYDPLLTIKGINLAVERWEK